MTTSSQRASLWWHAWGLAVAISLAATGVSGEAQGGSVQGQVPPRSGALSGVALDASTSAPIVGAAVTLRIIEPYVPAGREVASVVTDAKGRFVFVEVAPAASYRVQAARLGYLAYRSPATFPIEAGVWIENLTLALTPAGQLQARLLFPRGEPVHGAAVRLWRELWVAGQSRLVPIATSRTNDVGAALFSNLQPGRYAVCLEAVQTTVTAGLDAIFPQEAAWAALAQAPAISIGDARLILDEALLAPEVHGRRMAYRTECEPRSAGSVSEGLIVLGPGQSRLVDLQLWAVRGFDVTGQVVGPAGSYAGLPLRLFADDGGESSFGGRRDIAMTFVDRSGHFTFVNVPGGEYFIEPGDSISSYVPGDAGATPPVSPAGWLPGAISQALVTTSTTSVKLDSRPGLHASDHWGRTRVPVSGDVDDLLVRLGPAGRLDARINWKEAPASSFSVNLEPAGGDPSLGLPSGYVPQRRFEPSGAVVAIERIRPGAYFLRLSGPGARGWAIRSIRRDGLEVSGLAERPIVWQAGQELRDVIIEIGREVGSISGRVRDADETGAGASVIVFPVDRSAWVPLGLAPPRLRSIPVTITAHYRVSDLPAGRYYVAAIRGVPPPEWASVDFLERLPAKAAECELKRGDNLTLNLNAVDISR